MPTKLEESIQILSDKRLVRSIERGLKDLKEGKIKKYKDAKSLFSDIH